MTALIAGGVLDEIEAALDALVEHRVRPHLDRRRRGWSAGAPQQAAVVRRRCVIVPRGDRRRDEDWWAVCRSSRRLPAVRSEGKRREQELERGHEAPTPVRLLMTSARILGKDQRLALAVALAFEHRRELPGVPHRSSALLGADVEVDPPGRRAVGLDVIEQASSREPQRRAHRAGEAEGRRGPEERVEADEGAHRGS